MYLKNFQSLETDARFEELLEELKFLEWDIICGTETWRAADEEELDLPSGHLFVGAGGVKGSRGVGFFVHRRWKAGFEAFHAKSERVGVLDITIAGVALRLIVVYMPHTGYSDEEVESVYQTVGRRGE